MPLPAGPSGVAEVFESADGYLGEQGVDIGSNAAAAEPFGGYQGGSAVTEEIADRLSFRGG